MREFLRSFFGVRKPVELRTFTYEELLAQYPNDPKGVYDEFIRRLLPFVFAAARHYARRTCAEQAQIQQKAEAWTMDSFMQFLPQLQNGSPEKVLVRFAEVLKQILDLPAFTSVRKFYYRQLPLYHVEDERQRRALEVLHGEMLATVGKPEERVAEVLGIDKNAAEEIIRSANLALADVMAKRFKKADLRQFTEGVLPP